MVRCWHVERNDALGNSERSSDKLNDRKGGCNGERPENRESFQLVVPPPSLAGFLLPLEKPVVLSQQRTLTTA